jgi:hypothetical protein
MRDGLPGERGNKMLFLLGIYFLVGAIVSSEVKQEKFLAALSWPIAAFVFILPGGNEQI